MKFAKGFEAGQLLHNFRSLFRAREVFLHDGASMRRFSLTARQQFLGATLVLTTVVGACLSLMQIASSSVAASSALSAFAERHAERSAATAKVNHLEDKLAALKAAATSEVKRLEARQAFLAAVLSGEGDPEKLAAMIPAPARKHSGDEADLLALFGAVDRAQLAMASQVQARTEARYAETMGVVTKLGVPVVAVGGMGGPYEPVPAGAAAVSAQPSVAPKADPQFRALFNSWKRLDQAETTLVAIPSERPIQNVSVNSGFGVRSDPFRGGRAMHAGVDMPGPIGTPIYATADAVVGRTGWVGGYGNLVELEHGKGIQTRYGHLSAILVTPGTKVKRGQQIGLMGSTGRSTGSHLHYEVRIDGTAVNPIPFLQSSDYLLALQKRQEAGVAMGGPIEAGKAAGSK